MISYPIIKSIGWKPGTYVTPFHPKNDGYRYSVIQMIPNISDLKIPNKNLGFPKPEKKTKKLTTPVVNCWFSLCTSSSATRGETESRDLWMTFTARFTPDRQNWTALNGKKSDAVVAEWNSKKLAGILWEKHFGTKSMLINVAPHPQNVPF